MYVKRAALVLIFIAILYLCGCASPRHGTNIGRTASFESAFTIFSDPLSSRSPQRRPTSEAGTISGNFKVTPGGAATYTIPIDAPPGRVGIEPNIALVYNSHRGNGPMGVGWSVEGLSEIRRCRKTPVQDDIALDIQLDDSDALCLDSNRLVEITPTNCENGGIEYRPERDPFVKVCAYGVNSLGPDYFFAWDKEGRILKYGEADNSYPDKGIVEVNARKTTTLWPIGKYRRVTLAWPVTRIADRRGNYMTIIYKGTVSEALVNLAPTTEERNALAAAVGGPLIVPSQIAYTGFTGSGVNKTPQRTIDFKYSMSLRPDISYGHTRGNAIAITNRLERIVVNGPGEPGVWHYEIAYDNDSLSGRSRISSIRKCANDGACLPPLLFQWSNGPDASWTEISETPLSSAYVPPLTNVRPATAFTADVNGDGVGDLVQLGDIAAYVRGSTPASPQPFSTVFNSSILLPRSGMGIPIDINNDGRMDLLATTPPNQEPDPYYAAPTWYQSGPVKLERVTNPLPFADMEKAKEVWVGDFNGDNADDLLFYGGPGNDPAPYAGTFWSAVNSGSGLNTLEKTGITPNPVFFTGRSAFVMDVDGDGKDELLYIDQPSGFRRVLELEPKETGHLVWQVKQTAIDIPHWGKVIDVNGDGLDDIVTGGILKTWRNTGTTFEPPVYSPTGQSVSTLDLRRSAVIDYNGDGINDLLIPWTAPTGGVGGLRLISWNPITMKATRSLVEIPFRVKNLGNSSSPNYSGQAPWVLAADVTRDGLADVIVGDADGWRVYRRDNLGSNAATSDKLVGIRTGLNPPFSQVPNTNRPSIDISYAPTTEPGVYSSAYSPTACGSKSWCVNPVLTVVNHVIDNDVAPGSKFEYLYGHARVHHRGRGWIGFGKRIIREREQNTPGNWVSDTRETYDVDSYLPDIGDYPYRFDPLTVVRRWFSDQPGTWREQRHDAIEPQRRILDSGTYLAFYRSYEDKTRDYLGDGLYSDWLNKIVTTREFDDFGNLTSLNLKVETPPPSSTTLGKYLSNTRLAGRLDLDSQALTTETLSRTYYPHDESNWLISRVSSESTTSHPGICAVDPKPTWLDPAICDPVANSRIRKFTYTGDSLVRNIKIEPDQPELNFTTTLSYDGYGNIERLETTGLANSDGHVETRSISLEYEPSEGIFPLKLTNALSHPPYRLVFDRSHGSLVFFSNSNGIDTWMPIDGFGRLGAVGKSGGPTAFFEYINTLSTDERGPSIVRHASDSRGADVRIEFDRTGRATRAVTKGFDGKPVYRDIRYDDLGRLKFVSFPYFGFEATAGGVFEHGTTFTFDKLDRPTAISQPDGKATFSYKGLVSEMYSPRGHRSVSLTNGIGQTIAMQDAAGGNTQYIYGAYGKPAHLLDDDGNVTSFQFDRRGRRTRLVDPDLGTRIYRYNAFSELIQELNTDGEEHVRFDYDLLGRPITRKDADGLTQWAWDTAPGGGVGALASSESPDGQTEARSYDNFSRLIKREFGRKATSGENWTLSLKFGYNNQGGLRTIKHPSPNGDPLVVQYDYGPTGFLFQVRDISTPGAKPVLWKAKRYNAWGRIIEEGFGETPTGQPRLTTIRKYDPVTARLTKIETTRLTESEISEPIQVLTHWFDENGNLFRREDALQLNEIDTREEFLYDELDRLLAVFGADANWNRVEHIFSARYDSIGNIVSTSALGDYTYEGLQPHAVTKTGDTSYRYDDRGNMIRRGSTEITYTPFDLPRYVEEKDVRTTFFQYDTQGVRAIRESSREGTTLFVDGLYQRHENGIDKATELLYVPALSHHIGAWVRTPNGKKKLYFIHRDHLGTPTVITSAVDGRVVETRKYGPFGQLKSRWREGTETDTIHLGFTGHEDDPISGWVNMRGRIYDAWLGRFTTPDPFVQAPFKSQSLNRYSYVFNNPATLIDPTGWLSCTTTIIDEDGTTQSETVPCRESDSTLGHMTHLFSESQRFYERERRDTPHRIRRAARRAVRIATNLLKESILAVLRSKGDQTSMKSNPLIIDWNFYTGMEFAVESMGLSPVPTPIDSYSLVLRSGSNFEAWEAAFGVGLPAGSIEGALGEQRGSMYTDLSYGEGLFEVGATYRGESADAYIELTTFKFMLPFLGGSEASFKFETDVSIIDLLSGKSQPMGGSYFRHVFPFPFGVEFTIYEPFSVP